MKFIGITGGVGAGKSAVLDYLATKPGVRVMLADEIAHELMEPGTDCYEQIRQAFPEREIIGINCLPLIKQHGSLHCVTMQYPEGVVSIDN